MDSEERIEALHEISSDNDNYVKLSNGEKIGENLLNDLDKYFDFKIKLINNNCVVKNKFSILEKKNIYNILNKIKNNNNDDEIKNCIVKIENLISNKSITKDNKNKIHSLLSNDNDIKNQLKKVIALINVDPEIKLLKPIELIELKKDIIKIENIFKNKPYSSLDSIVLLDKFDRFKQKYKRLKDDLRQEDDELINVMIEDIIEKIKITYGIYDTNQREKEKIRTEIFKKIGIIDTQEKQNNKKEEEQAQEEDKKNIDGKNKGITYGDNIIENENNNMGNTKRYNIIENENNNNNMRITNGDNFIKIKDFYNYDIITKKINKLIINYKKSIIDKNYNNNRIFYDYHRNNSSLLQHLKEHIVYNHNINNDNIMLLIFQTYYELFNTYNIKFTKDTTDEEIKTHAIKIYAKIMYKMRHKTNTEPLLTIQNGGLKNKSNKKIENEESPPMLLEHYNSIKDIYIKLIISYYILIGNIGSEENEIKIINNDDEDKEEDIINDIIKEKKDSEEKKESEAKKENEAKNKAFKDNDVKEKSDSTKGDYKILIQYRETESNENKKIKKNNDRIKVLNDELKNITENLFELYIACNKIKQIPLMTEYDENIHSILIDNNVYLFKDKNDKKRHLSHYIIKDINKEHSRLIKENEDSAQEIIKIKKKIADAQIKDRFKNGQNNGYNDYNRYNDNNRGRGFFNGGGDGDNTNLKTNYTKLCNFLRLNTVGNNNEDKKDLKDLVYQLKEDSNYNYYDNNDMNNNDNGDEKTIYENIWNQYMKGSHISAKKNPLKNIEQGEILYKNVNEHNLVPEIVLGVNFQDKAIFVFLILIIRTIVMVFFELIIEYNLVKTLQYSIIIYAIIYLVLLLLSIGLVNYDSYKLRIVFNYLNVHMNSSNIILHIILFIIFVSLIMIMIDTEDLIHNVGYLFDYTKIYVHIYENTMTHNKEIFYNILTRDEKIKLLYRLEIITMIIFIFSAFIILLL